MNLAIVTQNPIIQTRAKNLKNFTKGSLTRKQNEETYQDVEVIWCEGDVLEDNAHEESSSWAQFGPWKLYKKILSMRKSKLILLDTFA